MAGRHRAARHRRRAAGWIRPAALGTVAAGALALTVYTTTGLVQDEDTMPAALAVSSDATTTTPSSAPTSTATSTTATSATSERTTSPEPTPSTTPEPEPPEPEPTEEPEPTTEEPAEPPAPEPAPCATDLEGTEPHVAQVGHHVLDRFAVDSVGGRASRANASDHPAGLALDFMVDPESGDAIAEYLIANQDDFGITYVIWEQRINSGSGWSVMEDRGSPTANHLDHVHVSFAAGADVTVSC
ncbi:hypothetical protein [Saccharomonospora piscinae]|uniref:hypothetical protein n=1 Tax=Saccharomonospora piscinae TaxID=687388 RepID=UPI000462FB31|nr:hypothetical protein [Saccharomonospora piscinae]